MHCTICRLTSQSNVFGRWRFMIIWVKFHHMTRGSNESYGEYVNIRSCNKYSLSKRRRKKNIIVSVMKYDSCSHPRSEIHYDCIVCNSRTKQECILRNNRRAQLKTLMTDQFEAKVNNSQLKTLFRESTFSRVKRALLIFFSINRWLPIRTSCSIYKYGKWKFGTPKWWKVLRRVGQVSHSFGNKKNNEKKNNRVKFALKARR